MRKPAVLGLFAVLILWLWQVTTVHFNYGGNWTGLFCIRDTMARPAFLQNENLYLFEHSDGYDGQVFHLIAHDPWMRKGSRDAIAGAAFRYQRIFVPALAWVLALGQDRWIHASYFAVILGFVFLGVYWTAKFAMRAGLAPQWGLVFAITPAAIVSIDRMTADIALAAFAAGFALYAAKDANWRVLAVLACAALTRETARPVIAGYSVFLLSRRKIAGAMMAAATVVPFALWYMHLPRNEPEVAAGLMSVIPFAGLMDRVFHPFPYPFARETVLFAEAIDLVALAGVALAIAMVFRMAARREWNGLAAAVYASTLAVLFLKGRAVWEDAYSFGRVFTPFMFLAMLHEMARRPWLALVPVAMVDARIILNFRGQVLGILHGLLK